MRSLIFGINTTLDGCCDHSKGIGDDNVHNYFADLIRNAGTLLYGRKTYELMVPYWPDMAKNGTAENRSSADFAHAFNDVPEIVVVSRSLEKPNEKTRIIRDNLREEIEQLKQQPGKDIMLGGVDVASQVIQMGLVDTCHFVVHPVLAGDGARLFKGISLAEMLQLELVDKKVFSTGCIALEYRRK